MHAMPCNVSNKPQETLNGGIEVLEDEAVLRDTVSSRLAPENAWPLLPFAGNPGMVSDMAMDS